MGDFPIGFGRYHLVERLAVGGMAELFVATSPGEHGFQKRVVIKRLLPHLVDDATYNAMFIDEAKLTARLVHPKIAQTFELGKVDDALYIAMELIDGIDVLALLREFASKRRRVDQPLAAWIAHEVLDALDYAHNITGEDGRPLGIVHRDISPSNVLLSVRGDIKLVDFGIARQIDPDRAHKSKTGTLKGKYGYMSPEQVIEQGLDARSDLFSVGVVLAELLTGRRLFAAANELDVLLMVRDAKLHRLDKYGADLDPGLSAIVRKALRKSVDERWPSAAMFRDALGEWLYERRYRVTGKLVADLVLELRDAVLERRHRQIGGGSALDDVSGPVRMASQSDGVVVVDNAEHADSMPNISVSYDTPPAEPRAVSVTDLAAVAQLPVAVAPRIETVLSRTKTPDETERIRAGGPPRPGGADSARLGRSGVPEAIVPRTVSEGARIYSPPPLPDVLPPLPALPALPAPPGAGSAGAAGSSSSSPASPASPSPGSPTDWPVPDREQEPVIEVPIADTISAAVEAITLPKRIPHPDDSQSRAFDDLIDPPLRMFIPPSAEEALRSRPPTPPALSEILEPPDDAGEFNVTPPLRVLFRLMTARATGLLVVAVGGIKKEIFVRDGQPEYVSSNVASELFGNYLVTKGVLSDGELAMALAMMPHYGGKLGDTLVGLGLLKPLEVFRHLTRQVRTKIIDVCSWNKGSFGWYAGRENPREAFPLDFNAFEILGAGAMALSDEHIGLWIAKHGNIRLRAIRTRRVGPERFEVKGLVELCDLLDGRRSVGDLVELQPDRIERLKTGRMLHLLESCDLARPVD